MQEGARFARPLLVLYYYEQILHAILSKIYAFSISMYIVYIIHVHSLTIYMYAYLLYLQKRGVLKGQVDLTKVKVIEKVQDGTFDKPSFQVITPPPPLLSSLLDDVLSGPDIICM